MRPPFPNLTALLAGLLLAAVSFRLAGSEFDILVYGATPAGISAALVAGRAGNRVLLVESGSRIGGMLTHGMGHPGFASFESRSGRFLEFNMRVAAHYENRFGPASPQLKSSLRGTLGEPSVNLVVLESMLAEVPQIQIQRLWSLEALKCSTNASQEQVDPDRSAEVAVFLDESGTRHPVVAHYFIDATYEGDLLAAAKVPYRIGREARSEFSESLAPEFGDDQLQATNFQPVLTRQPENRVPVPAPRGYRREDYTPLLSLLRDGRIRTAFGLGPSAAFQVLHRELPNGKQVLTDSLGGLVRLALPGSNSAWPDGDGGVAIRSGVERETLVAPFSRLGLALPRERIRSEHRRWTLGLLFFLQNDSSVPEAFRAECAAWGLPADEFRETVHFPEQPYVREARRMVARRMFTQQDTGRAEDDARSVFSQESVAISDCPLSSHLTELEGSRFGGRVSGGFEVWGPPVQVPLGVLLPRHVDNLLSACAVGASHVGFCALRYEPVWMSLGEAAAHVAHLANAAKRSIHRVPAAAVQRRLHDSGTATLYVSDVPPSDPDFQAVQWWGSVGGLHGLTGRQDSIRGASLADSTPFFAAFPGHAAGPRAVLTSELSKRWALIAQAAGIDASALPKPDGLLTRAGWIRAAHQLFLGLPMEK